MSEARKRILEMLSEGKITVEQSEELLNALNSDEQRPTPEKTRSTLASEIGQFAETVQKHFREAVKKVEPPGRELKSRLKEFGGWMQSMVGSVVSDFAQMRGEPRDGLEVQFTVPEPENFSRLQNCRLENLFGSIRVTAGSAFSLRITGKISKMSLEGQPPLDWFLANAITIDQNTLCLGLGHTNTTKAVLNFDLTLPENFSLLVRSVSADITVKGPFKVSALNTVSGDISTRDVDFPDSGVETVNGDVTIEGGSCNLRTSSTSGDFIIKGAKLLKMRVQSVSGDILLTKAEISEQSEIEMATTSGDVEVEKISGPWSKIEASARTGDVKIKWQGQTTPTSRNGVILESGQPGAQFKAETVSGDVEFD